MMRKLFVLFTAFLMSTTLMADIGFYHNPEREGESILVNLKGDQLEFVLFTFVDKAIPQLPTVSPQPPPPIVVMGHCESNRSAWYTGDGLWLDDFAIGNLYAHVSIQYPFSVGNEVSEKIIIGTFLIIAEEDGFILSLTPNGVMPSHVYMFRNPFHFISAGMGD